MRGVLVSRFPDCSLGHLSHPTLHLHVSQLKLKRGFRTHPESLLEVLEARLGRMDVKKESGGRVQR